jgi:hypothetical protein
VVREVLANLPALTMLGMELLDSYQGRPLQQQHDGLQLALIMAHFTQLQHVNIAAEAHGFVPWLEGLPGLTRLALQFLNAPVLESHMLLVGSLTALRQLAIRGLRTGSVCRPCMEAVRKLPLLEALELGYTGWSEHAVQLLVPPPARLKRVLLVVPDIATGKACKELDALQQLETYGVDVFVKGSWFLDSS